MDNGKKGNKMSTNSSPQRQTSNNCCVWLLLIWKFSSCSIDISGYNTEVFTKECNLSCRLAHYLYSHHWANESTSIAYIKNIIIPYITKERARLDLSSNHSALVLFDVFKGQCTPEVLKLLEDNHILYVTIPNNCTDKLQPLDLSVNKTS